MHEWSLVINLFRWLTIQTTFKIDSIPCNCMYIFKTFSEKYCLDYYIKRKKCSSFTDIYRVFRERRKRVSRHISATIMNGWNRECALTECTWNFEDLAFCPFNISELKDSTFHDTCSRVGNFLLVLAPLSQNLSVHNAGKYALSLVKRIHAVCGNTLLVFHLFV